MIDIRRILVPTDFSSGAERAFDLALLLAQKLGARVHVLHAIVLNEDDPHDPAHLFPEPERLRQRLVEEGDSAMDGLLGPARCAGVEIVRAQEHSADAAATVLDYAARSSIDLIVMGTHGRRGLTRFLLGSVAEKVVRHAPCPVLTVRGMGRERPATLDSVLVPVDFTEPARRALLTARDLADRCGARLHVLHVVEDLAYPLYYGLEHILDQRLLQKATAELDRWVSETLGGPAEVEEGGVEKHLVENRRAAPAITEFAEEQAADLIVMPAHAHGGFGKLLYGSTTERVVQLSTIPVLTLRSSGEGPTEEEAESTGSRAEHPS